MVTTVETTEPCPLGYWCSAGNKIPCSASTYNEQIEQIDMGACKACPANSYSREGSTSIANCVCVLGYYDELMGSDDVSCVRCPVGHNCSTPGVTLGLRPFGSTFADVPFHPSKGDQ